MDYQRRSLIILFLASCLCGMVLSAQSYAELPPKFRLLCLSGVTTVYFDSDSVATTLYPNPRRFSELIDAPANRRLEFYVERETDDPVEPIVRVPIARAVLPAGDGPFLVVLSEAAATSSLKFNSIVINHSLQKHPIRSFRTFNFSKRNMAVRLAESDMLLKPAESYLVPYPNGSKAWLMIAAESQDSGWLKVVGKPRSIEEQTRTSFFIVDSTDTNALKNRKSVTLIEIKERVIEGERGTQLR